MQGEGATPVEVAKVAMRRRASANLGIQRPRHTLDLAGKTIAGCAVGREAAKATNTTRFHAVMACGHPQIVEGSTLMAAERAGKIVKCSACAKLDYRALRKSRARKVRTSD